MSNTNNETKKKRGRKAIHLGKDYLEEYQSKLRCPSCNKKTKGEEDYKNIKTGKITKTCNICRSRVYSSYNKIREPTQKETIEGLLSIIKNVEKTNLDKILNDNPDLKKYIK